MVEGPQGLVEHTFELYVFEADHLEHVPIDLSVHAIGQRDFLQVGNPRLNFDLLRRGFDEDVRQGHAATGFEDSARFFEKPQPGSEAAGRLDTENMIEAGVFEFQLNGIHLQAAASRHPGLGALGLEFGNIDGRDIAGQEVPCEPLGGAAAAAGHIQDGPRSAGKRGDQFIHQGVTGLNRILGVRVPVAIVAISTIAENGAMLLVAIPLVIIGYGIPLRGIVPGDFR